MTAYDYHAMAEGLRNQADLITYRARQDARRAAEWYQMAASSRRLAKRLTNQPVKGLSAAWEEEVARGYVRLADTFLSSVFSATEHACRLRESARAYEVMARAAEERYARLMANPQF